MSGARFRPLVPPSVKEKAAENGRDVSVRDGMDMHAAEFEGRKERRKRSSDVVDQPIPKRRKNERRTAGEVEIGLEEFILSLQLDSRSRSRDVSPRFEDLETYSRFFRALVLAEVLADLAQAERRGWSSNQRLYRRVAVQRGRKEDEFVSFHVPNDSNRFIEGDVVVMSAGRAPIFLGSRRWSPHLLGMVVRPPGSVNSLLVPALPRGCSQDTTLIVRCNPTTTSMPQDSVHRGKDMWFLSSISNIVSLRREHVCLEPERLRAMPLFNTILHAETLPETLAESMVQFIPEKLWAALRLRLNADQLEAVQRMSFPTGSSWKGVRLLQGPPGTGKTTCILALCSIFFSGKNPSGLYGKICPPGHAGVTSRGRRRRRLLLCTQSNTAIDHVILRLQTDGLLNEFGGDWHPRIVRILSRASTDNFETLSPLVKETVLERRIQCTEVYGNPWDRRPPERGRSRTTLKSVQLELDSAERLLQVKRLEDGSSFRESSVVRGLQLSIQKLEQKKKDLMACQAASRSIVQRILEEADIVCSTLNGTGNEQILGQARDGFPAVIVDEATQATEPCTLLPLQYGAKQCVLIGDSKQLGPVVQQRSMEYECSLFRRLAKKKVSTLRTQFRMDPEIRMFLSEHFYEGALEDSTSVLARQPRPYHAYRGLGPFFFFDCPFGREERCGDSFRNLAESLFISLCVDVFVERFGVENIAVITPYRAQVALLRGSAGKKNQSVVIDTVDSFQGKEKDVVLISCVRTGSIGFLSDYRRLVVSLSRAKYSLLIVGRRDLLRRHEHWADLVRDAERRDLVIRLPEKPVFPFV